MPLAYRYITTARERDEAIDALSTVPMMGVDIESDSLYHYYEKVSLIQVTGGEKHYVFDPLLLDSVLELAPLFANLSILKIFHGADYDITSLKRDFDFKIGPVFDTAFAARAIGLARWSLKEVVSHYIGVTLSKVHQKSNWSLRPLSQGQLDYAAEDTAYLPTLYAFLSDEVAKKGRKDQIQEECVILENLAWSRKAFETKDYLKIKGARALSHPEQKILRELIETRDKLARERDLPPFKVAPNHDLIKLAVAPLQSEEAFVKQFRKGAILRDVPYWLEAIQKGMNSDTPLPGKEKKKNHPMTYTQQKILARLRAWRDRQAQSETVEAAMVINTSMLHEIAKKRPDTLEALASIPLLRPWQVSHYGESLMKEVKGVMTQVSHDTSVS